MAFLDNSGDIILDAVLTDAGRQRLARGDGSFKVVQFALGDDEINYGLFDKSKESSFQDLTILQTPIFEAFTNNIASLNSKLLTIPRTDLLFLPTIKPAAKTFSSTVTGAEELINAYICLVDKVTEDYDTNTFNLKESSGLIKGATIAGSNKIVLHQGLDTVQISKDLQIDQDLRETQYIVELDNRFGAIVSTRSTTTNIMEAAKSFVDDDNIAQYYFSCGTDPEFASNLAPGSSQYIRGPNGSALEFFVRSSLELQTSTYLFDTLGKNITINSKNYKLIKSNVTVTGATTGYSVNIPLYFLKAVV